MAPQTLTFLSWARERMGDLASATEHGRARAQTSVTLTGRDAGGAPTTSQTRTLGFLLAGPGDVAGLKPGAIRGRYPAPGTIDAESDKCSHVELADASLPWRYSPAANPAAGTGALDPWLALVVGVEGDELTLAGGSVTLSAAVQLLHPLGGPGGYDWAHVQVDEAGRRVARVLSGRALAAGQDYLAVLVPAFDGSGARAWTATAPVTLPVFDHWRFRTAQPAGSFRDLAAALDPGEAEPHTGRAPVDYPRVPAAPDLEIRGALAPVGSTVAALPTEVADDLANLKTPATDEAGRPIIGLPRYGDAWKQDPDTTSWGSDLNGDPRARGVAGLGLELGIRLQEELLADVAAHAGALDVAAQRIADLVLGLEAGRALWERRLPADPLRRLWVLGPALRRVMTDAGSIAGLATADDRALPRGIFSSAARRVLRPGPARSAGIRGGIDPAGIMAAANRCPDPPKPREDGVTFGDLGLDDFDERRRRAVESGRLDFEALRHGIEKLDISGVPDPLRDPATSIWQRLLSAAAEGLAAPFGQGIDLLLRALAVDPGDDLAVRRLFSEMMEFLERFEQLIGEREELLGVLVDLEEPAPEEPPCRVVDLDRLAEGVLVAFDPRGPEAPARVRVLGTIDGLDPAQPLAPPEPCVGLDRPTWRDLEGGFAEWLLPGVGDLPEDSVIAVETNPGFTDAFLTGYNTQLLGELRWRNVRAATGCTPLRVFWERADTGSGERIDDIIGIANWPDGSALGDPAHRPGGAAGRDLVLVFRGRLFLRYPRTLLYLVSAEHGGAVDFARDPAAGAARTLPTFQGRIGTDVTFFGFQGVPATDVARRWVVLEEPPTGYRFYNVGEQAPPLGADGAAFAKSQFANPVRVLIRGDRLVPGAGP